MGAAAEIPRQLCLLGEISPEKTPNSAGGEPHLARLYHHVREVVASELLKQLRPLFLYFLFQLGADL
jgi:hypothetical protein